MSYGVAGVGAGNCGPSYPVSPANCGPVGGAFSGFGIILVLFILLVIIACAIRC